MPPPLLAGKATFTHLETPPACVLFPVPSLGNSRAFNGLYFLGSRDNCAKYRILEDI